MSNYEHFNKDRLHEKDLQTLIGISQGIISDGIVNQKEAEFLLNWLIQHQHTEHAIFNNLFTKAKQMLMDNTLDQEESKELLSLLQNITGEESEIGEMFKSATFPINKNIGEVVTQGSSFVLTGTFAFGLRKECEQRLKEKKGFIHKNITLKTDYLVIGEYVTTDWKFQTFGRKIEKAIEYREKYGTIKIIQEKHLPIF